MHDLMVIASQFGNIPVIIAGDFNRDPQEFQAWQKATIYANWFDPLVQTNDQGESTRPITFSRSCNFKDPREFYSSIDAILLNEVAAAALLSIEPVYTEGRQHAPLRATFQWERVFQRGHVLIQPALLELEGLYVDGKLDEMSIQSNAQRVWENNFHDAFQDGNSEHIWEKLNTFAIQTLTTSGAKFGRGQKARCKKPKFVIRRPCPGQNFDGTATTARSAVLEKMHHRISELRCRLARPVACPGDHIVTWNLYEKIRRSLQRDKLCHLLCYLPFTDISLLQMQKDVQHELGIVRQKEKMSRIQQWKTMMIHGTRSKQVSKCVYQWIDKKTTPFSPNLVLSRDGHVLVQPSEAFDEFHDVWDDEVFGVNAMHQSPHDLLRFVWPYIEDKRSQATLPELCGSDMKNQILRRKASAAAGLDGWRTPEVQALPVFFYEKIAIFFQGVENGIYKLPESLCTARQVLLPKSAKNLPLSKRIISLLPVWLLCWSGLRFRQLQSWQQQVCPAALLGGILGRKLVDVPLQLSLEVDKAVTSNEPIIGIKLDKAKSFDRLVPAISSMLMIALGVPLTVTRVFQQMYDKMARFTTLGKWTSPGPIFTANGLVQGCSISILALNCHMAVWAIFMDRYPHVVAKAYIDDSYLWTKITHAAMLRHAFEATELWDRLTGQLINHGKSQIWATNTAANRVVKNLFPNVPVVHCLEVLGTRIQTTQMKATGWPESKTEKICHQIQMIGLLPCKWDIREHLLASKIIPQISFCPMVGNLPSKALQDIQNAAVAMLWKGRPNWRSKWLVMGLLCKPYRADPFVAREYQTVLDTITFLKHTSVTNRQLWCELLPKTKGAVNSLVLRFKFACAFFGLEIVNHFWLQYRGSQSFSMLDLSKRELKLLLQNLSRQVCYQKAAAHDRKDILPAQGTLDFAASRLAHKKYQKAVFENIPFGCLRDASIVGCHTTNDRRGAAGMSASTDCRFCKATKETLEHLCKECAAIHTVHPRPDCPNLGPNFCQLGIVEVDDATVQNRLRTSDLLGLPVCDWYADRDRTIHIWTDGSVFNIEHFWYTTGGFCFLSADGTLHGTGQVYHPALSSYATELYAFGAAFFAADSPVCIHTDCLSLQQQVEFLITHQEVDMKWSHLCWWFAIRDVFIRRQVIHPQPISIKWIPSHVVEHLPEEAISVAIASKHGTTVQDIVMNRRVDKIAKTSATLNHPFFVNLDERNLKIEKWQWWLTQLQTHLAVPTDQREKPALEENEAHIPKLSLSSSLQDCKALYPLWDWSPIRTNYTWTTSLDAHDAANCKLPTSLSKTNWKKILQWLVTLSWDPDPNGSTSFLQLGFAAWHAGVRLEAKDLTPACYATMIRKAFNIITKKFPDTPAMPGEVSEKCKSDGKVHTSGYIKCGKIAMSFPANRMLGVAFVGRNHVLSNWKFLFNSISWSLFFLFSWWLRRESRFFDARGLRDRVLRVRTPPALCEQLTNIFQRGWNHQPVPNFVG